MVTAEEYKKEKRLHELIKKKMLKNAKDQLLINNYDLFHSKIAQILYHYPDFWDAKEEFKKARIEKFKKFYLRKKNKRIYIWDYFYIKIPENNYLLVYFYIFDNFFDINNNYIAGKFYIRDFLLSKIEEEIPDLNYFRNFKAMMDINLSFEGAKKRYNIMIDERLQMEILCYSVESKEDLFIEIQNSKMEKVRYFEKRQKDNNYMFFYDLKKYIAMELVDKDTDSANKNDIILKVINE
ncbi:MAG: hypothetical protein K9L30_15885 [Desulfobacterales bacterium]|nr:hypothetical protein [Desulfobacterales bacterium]